MIARAYRQSACLLVLFAFSPLTADEKPKREIHLKTLPGGKVLASGRHEFARDDFRTKLQAVLGKYRDGGVHPRECLVHVAADDRATYGEWMGLVQICQEEGLERFVAEFERSHQIDMPLAAAAEGLPDDRAVIPLRISLRARDDGALSMIVVNGKSLGTIRELQDELILMVGDERGPRSIAETAQVEIDSNPALQMKFVAQAYDAAAGYRASDGDFIALLQDIGPPRGEEIEEIEFETIELEELVIESIEAPEVAAPIEVAPVDETPLEIDKPFGLAPMGGDADRDRAAMLKEHGGTEATEKAVELGLKWIVSRQSKDGGWNFNHNKGIAAKPCPHPGTAERARNGATALALLPLLYSGHTHKDGDYKKEVHAGLGYLIANMKVKDRTGSWHEPEGSLYSHGYAAQAICEAYAQTKDKDLLKPAQLAVNYLVFAQDPVGGGWRYNPRQAGDTSATAVQFVALKKAHHAHLEVPKGTIVGTVKYLDSVQADRGSQYGYTAPATGRSGTNAMGLLCRIYSGWEHDRDALARGVALFDKAGPSKMNHYYNYYASQVMFHYGGDEWKRWNAGMQKLYVDSQDKAGGPAHGSWWAGGSDHGAHRGGRLYCTSMACMTLQTYYRAPRAYGD